MTEIELNNPNLDHSEKSKELRRKILSLVEEYGNETHQPKPFIPGTSIIPVSGRVFDYHDIQALTSSSLDFWLTAGRFNTEFENQLSKFLGIKFVSTTNSGSSANLLAISCLTSKELGERSLKPNDEIITVAAGFPTTVNPILQNGLIPVFVDVKLPYYNIYPDQDRRQ